MLIAVLNQSTLVQDNDVQLMCQAVQKQLLLHACPAWKSECPKVEFYPVNTPVPGYAWVINMIDDDTLVPGALGYHTEVNDKIVGYVMCKPVLDNGGVVLYDPNNPQNVSISSVLSHEILETTQDKFCVLWADGPEIPQGSQYAFEIADCVEGDSYVIEVNGTSVSVSNFIFPAWFNQMAKSPDNMPFDYLKKLTQPFTMTPGGYMCVRDKRGNISQVFGHKMPEWKQKAKKNSRRTRKQPVKKGMFGWVKGLFTN